MAGQAERGSGDKDLADDIRQSGDIGAMLPEAPGEHPMEIWISYTLRIGVMLAGAIILIGLLMFVIGGAPSSGPHSLNDVLGNGGHSISVSLGTIVNGVTSGNPIAVIQLGVLVLILTPTMRVLMTIFLFIAQQDTIFVVITVIVFVVLIIGLIGLDKSG